jgi:tetratricopeptide (TPR) repeat protein
LLQTVVTLAFCALAQLSDYDRGVALFEKGDPASALPFFDRAAQADPRNAQKWKAAGAAHAALKHYADAEEAFGRACKLDYKLPDACFFHARALYALDRFEEALASLEHADPRNWRARLARAESLEALGRSAPAEQEYKHALTLCRNADPKPAIGYAEFLVRQGRAAEAIPRLEEALTAHPATPDVHLWLGRALFETNKLPDALPHLEKAAALNPSSATSHLLLAKALTRLGRPTEAQPHYDLAAKYAEAK